MKIIGEGFFRYSVPDDYVPDPEWEKEIKIADEEMQKDIASFIDNDIIKELKEQQKKEEV